MKRTWTFARGLARLRTSRIGLRILAFNILVLFLPIAGVLYLDVYEAHLLDMQERGMIEQARLVAAALGGGSDVDPDESAALVARLGSEGETRIRVFDRNGLLVADSRRLLGLKATPGIDYRTTPLSSADGRSRILYRLGALLERGRERAGSLLRSLTGRTGGGAAVTSSERDPAPELRAALRGGYGASTRPTPGQRSLTMTSAVPVRSGDTVTGAVVVSQSTFRILQALYGLRLRIFEVVVASIVVAALLSALMSGTIVRPLVRLRRAAASLAERRAPLTGSFNVVARRDEIGDLASALETLAHRLDAHIRLLESFAADVSHEFRNPLASIRTAAEMLVATDDPAARDRFYTMLTRDVDRLERLVAGVRELAQIDAQLAQEPVAPIDVGALLAAVIEAGGASGRYPTITLRDDVRASVRSSPDRLTQVFDNILQNATSLAPGRPIEVSIERDGEYCRISFLDRGPGIPDAHLERIFERFFSYRPQAPGDRRQHVGLGLAISRAIVEGYGGTITAQNRDGGGACFVVRLPLG